MREIWVVEDNDQNFELVDYLLSDAGWSVRRARDGAGFERLLSGAPPRLVLLDMHLPDAAGLDLLARLRADRRFDDVPVIALTAHAMRGDREKFLAAGCDGYLSKPIETSTFVATVEERLERSR
ncbi:MAG: hypothetical protein AMXMBFR36_23570 [Acidobacteriota bacterium]